MSGQVNAPTLLALVRAIFVEHDTLARLSLADIYAEAGDEVMSKILRTRLYEEVRAAPSEFGAEYTCPHILKTLPGVHNTSWGNDVCPSFEVYNKKEGEGARLWVDAVEFGLREMRGSRFGVDLLRLTRDNIWEMMDNGHLLSTDDFQKALDLFLCYRGAT